MTAARLSGEEIAALGFGDLVGEYDAAWARIADLERAFAEALAQATEITTQIDEAVIAGQALEEELFSTRAHAAEVQQILDRTNAVLDARTRMVDQLARAVQEGVDLQARAERDQALRALAEVEQKVRHLEALEPLLAVARAERDAMRLERDQARDALDELIRHAAMEECW